MDDFHAEPNKPAVSDFCEIYNTKNILKEKIFKELQKSTCIDLILSNRPRNF